MDPISENVTPGDPLRLLFQECGHHAAPDGLEARVLEKMAAPAVPAHRPAPLVGRWGWAVAVVLLVLISLAGLRSVVPAPTLPHQIPGYAVEPCLQAFHRFINAPWMAAMTLGVATAMLLERLYTLRMSKLIVR